MRHYGILSPPREILVLLVNWDVSDLPHEQFVAALTISSVIALFIYGIFHFVAIHVCHKRTSGENCGKEKTLWTVHNKRYDLKSFVKAHPGGSDCTTAHYEPTPHTHTPTPSSRLHEPSPRLHDPTSHLTSGKVGTLFFWVKDETVRSFSSRTIPSLTRKECEQP